MAQFILDSNTPMKAYWRWGIVLVALSAGVLSAALATATLAGTPVTMTALVTPSAASGRVTFYDGVGVSAIANGRQR